MNYVRFMNIYRSKEVRKKYKIAENAMLPMIACLNGSYNNSATITGFYIRSDHSMKLLVRMKGQKNAEWNELQDARSLINKGSLYALGEIKHRQFSLLASYKIRF